MKNIGWTLASAIIGGVSFWVPNLFLFPMMKSMNFFFVEISIVCPLLLLVIYGFAVWYRKKGERTGPSSALFALIGIWLMGPWIMAIAGTLAGGPGLHKSSDYMPFLWMSLCPPLTLYFSAMQGNVLALIVATILMLVCHRVFEKGRWVIFPGWKHRIHFRRNHG